MSLPNPGMSFTPFDILPASDLNDIVENIEALSAGTGFGANVITSASLAASAALLNLDSSATNIPFVELARTTLGVAGDTISVTSIPARKYLKVIVWATATGGTINAVGRFNNDTAANYTSRSSTNGAVDGTALSATSMGLSATSSSNSKYIEFEIINVATFEKLLTGHCIESANIGAGSGTARADIADTWANSSVQINRIDIVNTGTGDFAIGSEVLVLGKN